MTTPNTDTTPQQVVEEMNTLYYVATDDEWHTPFEVRSNGNCELIMFAGETIWQSGDDEREFIEDEDRHEPLLPYIKRIVAERTRLLSAAFSAH